MSFLHPLLWEFLLEISGMLNEQGHPTLLTLYLNHLLCSCAKEDETAPN